MIAVHKVRYTKKVPLDVVQLNHSNFVKKYVEFNHLIFRI